MCKVWIALFVLLICSACELVGEIDYETTGSTNYIVMYGFMSYENGVNVLVKKTVPANDHDADDVIENPTVWLCGNNSRIQQLFQNDEYKFSLTANSVQFDTIEMYSIEVEAPGFEMAVSNQQKIIHKTLIDTAYIDADSNFVYCVFNDNVTTENYYSWKVYYFYDGKKSGSDTTRIIPNYTFDDEGFDGQVVKYGDLSRGEYDSIQIKLFSVSKDYADFIDSYFDYELSYADYNYETVYPVGSQVENGFGLFVGYEVDEYIIINSTKLLK